MSDAPERMLRLNTVLDRTGLSRATLYRKIADGSFPKQIKLSTRCAGWRESAVNAWLRSPIYFNADELEAETLMMVQTSGSAPPT